MPRYWEQAQWEKEDIGRDLVREFDDYESFSVFVVIRSKNDWTKLEVEELNPESISCQCRWVMPGTISSLDSPTDSEATVQSSADQIGSSGYGVIALQFPAYIHEKEQEHLPPCFLFGRKTRRRRYADVWFAGDSTSRSEFILEVKNGCHVIRALHNDLIIRENIVISGRGDGIALHHHEANRVQWERRVAREQQRENVELEFYCKDTPEIRLDPFRETPTELCGSLASSITETDSGRSVSEPMDIDRIVYIYTNVSLSTDDTPRYLALNPWTCIYYDAATYAIERRAELERRVQLVRNIPMSDPFLRPEYVYVDVQNKLAHVLTPLREGIPLADVPVKVPTDLARRLLFRLLEMVSRLHEDYGVFSRNIDENTILFADDVYEVERIFFNGLLHPTTKPRAAFEDCWQIFQTVRRFLNRDVPASWLGHELLDKLYREAATGDQDSWPYDVVSLCRQLQINSSTSGGKFWSTLKVQKVFNIRFKTEGEASKLHSKDVEEYLYTDAVRHLRKSTENRYALFQRAMTAIQSSVRDDEWISVASYQLVMNHLKTRHGSSIGEILECHLPGSRFSSDISSPISVRLEFQVPYHAGHGLINISYLRSLAPKSFQSTDLEARLPDCLEVRGAAGIGGVYIRQRHLRQLSGLFGLQFDNSQLKKPTDVLRSFSNDRCYLIAPHLSARLFPVDRETGNVQVNKSQMPQDQFFEQYLEADTRVDAAKAHSPASLLVLDMEVPLDHSCQGSVGPSTQGSLRFEFGKRQNEVVLVPPERKTMSWVEDIARGKRRKRNRADIQPTIFGSQTQSINSPLPAPAQRSLGSTQDSTSDLSYSDVIGSQEPFSATASKQATVDTGKLARLAPSGNAGATERGGTVVQATATEDRDGRQGRVAASHAMRGVDQSVAEDPESDPSPWHPWRENCYC